MADINRPNFNIVHTKYKYLGDNTLRRTFNNCFNIMLSSCYSDYTKGGRYYNDFDEKQSKYYVNQVEIEEELNEFTNSSVDNDCFLVGFTGIGKTTLLKNFYGIKDANPFIDENNNIIAYLSVYSDDLKNEQDVKDTLCGYLKSIITFLQTYYNFELESDRNISIFYNYVYENKSRLLNNWNPFEKKSTEMETLIKFEKEHPIQFYSIFIKFLLKNINRNNSKINELIMIFDDIESQDKDVHIPFISTILNISSCLRNTPNDRLYLVKSLISLRAYTFRYHKARQAQAKRVYEENVILKKTIPPMKDIFIKRFNVYYEDNDIKEKIADENRWLQSKEVLMNIVNNLSNFGDIISSASHYDISHALSLFLKVVTNKRWFAPNESYYEGSYPNPELENYSYSIMERVYKALFYGEADVFVDNEESIFPNVLYIHSEENPGNELMTLYILEHMKQLERNNNVTLYGKNKISGKELSKKICNIFNDDSVKEKVDKAIAYLYEKEYLLHSIFEPENNVLNSYTNLREYNEKYGLYLSIRGNKILQMFESDSMLFEIFRDDIDTELENNTIPSSKLGKRDKMVYLIKYCNILFDKEKHYISISNQEEYFKMFGNKFIITRLLTGIKQSFVNYYKKNDEDAQIVRKQLLELFERIEQYKILLLNNNEKLNTIDISFINKEI